MEMYLLSGTIIYIEVYNQVFFLSGLLNDYSFTSVIAGIIEPLLGEDNIYFGIIQILRNTYLIACKYSCNIIVAAIRSILPFFCLSFFFIPISTMAREAILEVNRSSTV